MVMKRIFSLMTVLSVCAVSLSMVSQVYADDFSVVMDEVPEDVSIDVQLEQYEDEVLMEGDETSVLMDAEEVVEDLFEANGDVDEAAIDALLDDLESQIDMILESDMSADDFIENGVLDKFYQLADLVNGQRRYLSQNLKDRLRDIAKWHRKVLAKYKDMKDEIKSERKEAQKKIRSAKGSLRSVFRQRGKLDFDQLENARKRLKMQANDADMEREEEAEMQLKERVRKMRMKCADDKEMCKMKLKEKRSNRMEALEKVDERMNVKCEMAEDVEACKERLEEMRMKRDERARKMKMKATELRDACIDRYSDACEDKKDEIKDTIKENMMEMRQDSGGGVINRLFNR